MKEEKYLPIGTVVLLKGGEKKLMINGYCAVCEEDKDTMYDYRGSAFPEGVLETNGVALFNHDQIKKICHMGWKNDESIDFSDKLNIIVEKINSKNKDA